MASPLRGYNVLRAIGKGSYGEVFLVRSKGERRQFVMKNIPLPSRKEKERNAAEQEASLLSQLQHPNIVSYRESFQDENGVLHIIMGYCEGGDLCSRLKSYRGKLLPEMQVVEWFVQITLALQYLHERNILHRDLKTQNIFLTKSDIIKVGDLGIARVLDASSDLAHTVIGTPYYMSPEQFAGTPYNHKSDIWALGCCAYEMATLHHAFSADNISSLMYRILHGEVPPLPAHQFSQELSGLVCSMLSRSPAERPSVHQILRMEFIKSHIRTFLERAEERRRQKRLRRGGGGGGGGEEGGGRGGVGKHCERKNMIDDRNPQDDLRAAVPGGGGGGHPISRGSGAKSQPTKQLPHPLPPDSVASPAGDKLSRLSLARERRRRNRQEQSPGGRIVLRSRSNESLPQQHQPPLLVEQQGKVKDEAPSSSQVLAQDQQHEEHEEEEKVICLLDTTLHLAEPSRKSRDAVTPLAREAFIGTSVKLRERSKSLRDVLVGVLGEEQLRHAMMVLNNSEHDQQEEKLSDVIGQQHCHTYISRLRELQLYECLL